MLLVYIFIADKVLSSSSKDKKAINSSEWEYTFDKKTSTFIKNNEKCPDIFDKNADKMTNYKYPDDVYIVARNIFLKILENMNFPINIEINLSYEEINKDDLHWAIYFNYVLGLYDGLKYSGKEEIIRKLLSSLARLSRHLIAEYTQTNFAKATKLRNMIFRLVFRAFDVKMDDKCEWNVVQIFDPIKYETIIYMINTFRTHIERKTILGNSSNYNYSLPTLEDIIEEEEEKKINVVSKASMSGLGYIGSMGCVHLINSFMGNLGIN
ncbi:uncharacterized protein VNE69_06024 [Vairimorpha necatrix]|uniref:Uncharacterized protein n=2 Tax=Vairimorpha necatrix TaxID=6039 RepID=A0AAX4JCM1_9MICR